MAQIPQSTSMIAEVSKPAGFAKYVTGVEDLLFKQGKLKIGTSCDGQVEKTPARTGDYIVYVKDNSANKIAFDNWSVKVSDAAFAKTVSARPNWRRTRDLPSGAIGFKASAVPGGEEFTVPFGEIRKPTNAANLGDVAEGVLAIALACRFKDYRPGGNVTSDDILAMCRKLNAGSRMGTIKGPATNANKGFSGFAVQARGKGKEIQAIFQTPNKDMVENYVDDDLCLYIGLSASSMKYLLEAGDKKSNQSAMKNMLAGSAKYANGDKVKKWAELVYTNRRYDFIECRAVGLAGAATVRTDDDSDKGTKVDVEVNITDDEGKLRTIVVNKRTMGVDIKISLKHGGVEQFGQKGGTDWETAGRTMGYEKYFNILFGDSINVSRYETAFKDAKGPSTGKKSSQNVRIRNAVGGLYKSVAKDIQTQLEGKAGVGGKRTEFYQNLANGIIYFATLNQPFVHLVQLTANEARTYNFEKLPLIWAHGEPAYEAICTTYHSKVAKGPLPKIIIKEPGTQGKTLFTFRVRAETREGLTYYRNYVEKGSALKNLKGFITT